MQEEEITADISGETYHRYLKRFEQELGKPFIQRRVAFMVLQRGVPLDNRIKITNGKAQIVQKLRTPANELGKRISGEIEIGIPGNVDSILQAIKLFQNFYRVYKIETLELIIQHENSIWATNEYELKNCTPIWKTGFVSV